MALMSERRPTETKKTRAMSQPAVRTPNGIRSALLAVSLGALGLSARGAEVYIPESVPYDMLFQEERPGYRVGPADIYPRIGGATLYDDNIFLNKAYEKSDLIWM